MTRIQQVLAWGFFALLAYLIFTNIVAHWVQLPGPGNIGFVLVFTAFSLLHGSLTLGTKRVLLFVILTVVISYFMEEVGVRTGLVFGPYHYSDMLGPKLSNVPLLIPLGWFMMIYPSWVVAQALLGGVDVRRPLGMVALALIAALTMTGWDMVMDPPMVAHGNWIWEQGGPYFGVPLHNYFGWVLTTFLVYLIFDIVDRAIAKRDGAAYRFGGVFAVLPVVIYTFFALEYVVPGRLPPLILIAVFTMLLPGALALTRLVLPAKKE